MGKFPSAPLIAAAFLMTFTAAPAWAGHVPTHSFAHTSAVVEITGLGNVAGEFCRRDRAIIFKDPDGTTILFDAGRTGVDDPLLGGGQVGEFIDVVLMSSVHGDHLGNEKFDITDQGTCGSPKLVSVTPNANTTDIAFDKDAQIFVGGEMRDFLKSKMGDKDDLVDVLRPGGERKPDGSQIKIAVVQAIHSNGVGRAFLTGNNQLTNPAGKKTSGVTQHVLSEELAPDGLTAYVGPDHGYIIQFTNGLVVYLTADTGQTSDMRFIAGFDGFYAANLAVVNMGGVFSMGPKEAAWAVDTLIQPASVIPTHSNQESTSGGGNIIADSKMDKFAIAVGVPVHVPRSGVTMTFDGDGVCLTNC